MNRFRISDREDVWVFLLLILANGAGATCFALSVVTMIDLGAQLSRIVIGLSFVALFVMNILVLWRKSP